MPKVGDRISLREWKGKPYRSKQRVLREAIISDVQSIWISDGGILIGKMDTLTVAQEWSFAQADGFNTPKDMLEWFNFTHGLPFKGIVIHWK